MPSIHDSLLIGYEVDGRGRRIVLHTVPHQGGGEVPIDVIFEGVGAYHLEGDCLQNIIFDIVETSAQEVVGDGRAFRERHRWCGWPRDWDSRTEEPAAFFAKHELKIFALTCSYGITGWVAARSVRQVVID